MHDKFIQSVIFRRKIPKCYVSKQEQNDFILFFFETGNERMRRFTRKFRYTCGISATFWGTMVAEEIRRQWTLGETIPRSRTVETRIL